MFWYCCRSFKESVPIGSPLTGTSVKVTDEMGGDISSGKGLILIGIIFEYTLSLELPMLLDSHLLEFNPICFFIFVFITGSHS